MPQQLKQRIISAAVLLPLVIAGILWLPTFILAILSGIVVTAAAWEWLQMTTYKDSLTRSILLLLLLLITANVLWLGIDQSWIYWLSLAWWLLGLIGVCYFPRGKEIWRHLFLQPLVGLILFVPAWLAFNTIHTINNGPIWVLFACALIWGSDTGAFVAGKLWGKTKLAPEVSPGKTWAGFYGSIVAGVLISLIFYVWLRPAFTVVQTVWLGLLTVLFATLGDLVESLLKRVYQVKDSGSLIPGHGGLLDRTDSMLAAFPIYLLGLQILGIMVV